MDAETFYAKRAEQMEAADDELRFDVEDALQALANGEDGWHRELVTTASTIWLDTFNGEAPGKRHGLGLARFRKELTASLEQTTPPDGEPSSGQINRVTYWVTTYTINSATHAALVANGVRFQRWVTRRDSEVREIHKPLDGQIRPVGGTFTVAGSQLHYPGEPAGPPEVWISCRCVIQPAARKGETMTDTTYEIGPEEPADIDNPDIITSDDAFTISGLKPGTPYHIHISQTGATLTTGAVAVASPSTDTFATVTDPTDIAVEPVDEDDLVDDDLDGEEEITELPVHGVIAPEGVPTGDGRMFELGALSTRELPIPLRVEIVSTHGGMTSDVVTIGRVDEAWRDDATDSWRWRGAIVLDKPHAQETIAGIIDGTVRGVSLDGDDAIEDTSERDRLVNLLNTLPDDSAEFADTMAELQALPTIYSQMRTAGLTIVPIPAFQEAYIGLGHDFTEDLTDQEHAALAACGCLDGLREAELELTDEFRDYDAETRKKMADAGTAMPDGSFPIADEEDLRNAIQSIGRASDPDAAKAHIRKRARALGKADLIPEDWELAADVYETRTATYQQTLAALPVLTVATGGATDGATFAPGTHDGPGWITHPVPTSRIRRYWVSGKGAAKIRWGTPGDFNRCRRQLAKYVQNPDWLAGLCANMHYEALGIWPATHAGKKAHAVEGMQPAPAITAAGALKYPAAWFENPGLDHAAPMRIEGERIYGYLAQWGVCHIGIQGLCRDVPHSNSGYGYFLKGVVDTERGEQRVGTLTYGIGHASPNLRAAAATAHYDQTEAVRAFVNIGEDEHGIWFAGVLAPWVTEDDVFALRAIGALSGDWRNWSGLPEDYELVGAVAVNTPGYQLAASGAIGLGYIPSEEPVAPVLASATVRVGMDPELVGAIARTAVAEYRHQEKVEASLAPHRDRIRATRLAAARARLERVN